MCGKYEVYPCSECGIFLFPVDDIYTELYCVSLWTEKCVCIVYNVHGSFSAALTTIIETILWLNFNQNQSYFLLLHIY